MSPRILSLIAAGPMWVPIIAPAGPVKYLPLDGPPPLRFQVAAKSHTSLAPLPPIPNPPVAEPTPESGPEPATTETVAATLPTPGPSPDTNALPAEVKTAGIAEARPSSPPPPTISPQSLIPFFTAPIGGSGASGGTATVVAAPVTFVPPELTPRGVSRATYTTSP